MAVQRNESVQLGCGTLILIALIVLFFSRGSSDELSDEVRQVSNDLRRLEKTVSVLKDNVARQSEEIRLLRTKLEDNQKKQPGVDRIDFYLEDILSLEFSSNSADCESELHPNGDSRSPLTRPF